MAISKASLNSGVPKPVRKLAAVADGTAPTDSAAKEQVRAVIKISTVSHTLDSSIAEQLRHFAFRERISESAVIEFALRTFFSSGSEGDLGKRLRDAGAALRRKS